MIFQTDIMAHKAVAKGTHELTLRRPLGFEFQAGQYTQIGVSKLTHPDPKGRSRQFSIASSPTDITCIKVVFRATGSGFKQTLMSAPIGSTVTLEQAAGSFLLPQSWSRPQVFVAGGVGISAFIGYLQQTVADSWNHPITLIYGNQNPESAAYLSELKTMSKQQPQFSLTELYKRPTPDLFSKLTSKYQEAKWWIVGPPAMVAVTVNGLRLGGINDKAIIVESFDGY